MSADMLLCVCDTRTFPGFRGEPCRSPSCAVRRQEYVQSILYKERYRPQYHFTSPANWMNDPNGLLYHDGEYHLFYQYNPKGNTWGWLSWGHAVSTDLVHWENLPLAIPTDGKTWIFSGSAVADVHNTSGFATNGQVPLVAIFTAYNVDTEIQDQRLAYSLDRGRTWSLYEGNPVLDLNQVHFRDPKVFWYEPLQEWRMVVTLSRQLKVLIYGSPDLKHWNKLSEFGGPGVGATTFSWECPDLFPLPVDCDWSDTKWVMMISVESGGPSGLHGMQYFIGDFDGFTFTSHLRPEDVRWEDYGRDFYAAQSYSGIPPLDGRRILMGWMNAPAYANSTPSFPWRGAQSVPRELRLVENPHTAKLEVQQSPVEELQQLREKAWQWQNITLALMQEKLAGSNIRGQAREVLITFRVSPDDAEFGINVLQSDSNETVIGYVPKKEELYVDVTRSGDTTFDPRFTGVRRAPLGLHDGTIKLHILIDWSSVEVFANDGSVVMTNRVYPGPESDGIQVVGPPELLIEECNIYSLNSIWHKDLEELCIKERLSGFT